MTRVTKEIKKLIRDMIDTMHEAGGIGLAAPQVGVSKRVIVIDISEYERKEGKKTSGGAMAFLNPEFIFQEGVAEGEEGCLSFPSELRGYVPRAERITVKVMTPQGKTEHRQADELMSRVFQHEIDHVNGVLFVDRMSFSQKLKLREALNLLGGSALKKSMA